MQPGLESFSVDGRVVLVVGGTSGIGRMMADGFVRAGSRVYVASRKADAAEAVAAELSRAGQCHPLTVDVGDRASISALVAALAGREDHLDVLVDAAGVTWAAPLEEFPETAFDRAFAVNVKGPFYLTADLLPLLRRAVATNGAASVIVIGSSDGSLVPTWENYAYSSSKAALHHLTRHLATRLAPMGIRVNCLAPGPFRSRMSAFALDDPGLAQQILGTVPLGRAGLAEEAAGAAIFLASRASGYITGSVIPLDGGWDAARE